MRQAETSAEMCCCTTFFKNHGNIVCDNVAVALGNVAASQDDN
jgi:uracil-DNA glycosylase